MSQAKSAPAGVMVSRAVSRPLKPLLEPRSRSGDRPLLILRVDGSRAPSGPGIGHATRSLALAAVWAARGGDVLVMTRELPEPVAARYRRFGAEVTSSGSVGEPGGLRDAAAVAEEAHRRAAAWVVVDGYQFGRSFQSEVSARARLLVIDDHGSIGEYHAAMVLDHNVDATAASYERRPPACALLLGSRYALVGSDLAERDRRIRTEPARTVLFVLGGGPSAAWLAMVRGASRLIAEAGLNARVLGAFAPPDAGEVSWLGFRDDVAFEMTQADLCVAAAGSVIWEICRAGVPALLTSVAENQCAVARAVALAGAAVDLGWWECLTDQDMAAAVFRLADDGGLRKQLSLRSMQLVDGRGAGRVVDEMWPRLRLRRAEPRDARMLWNWANDPITRLGSFSVAAIPWEDHREWFASHLASTTCLHLIAIGEEGQPVGQVSFERQQHGDVAEVHFSVDPGHRGRGLGTALLRLGTADAFAAWADTDQVIGRVKPSNLPSMHVFDVAGFQRGTQSRGGEAVHWSRCREDQDVRR
jgi:UDP-2,4-diacetamido-2,4,6-trideoxy-beta-L-altropyranose hydrolase